MLRSWDLPAVALIGTHVRATSLNALSRFACVYLVLDNDEAGRSATQTLASALGSRARTVSLPGVKDVADLALHRDGREVFAQAVEAASRPASAQAALAA